MDAQASSGGAPELWHFGSGHPDVISSRTFGMWLYMMSDAMIFAGLFAAYGVLDHPWNTAGGPGPHQVSVPLDAFWQTLAVLSSVLAYSLGTVSLKRGSKSGMMLGIFAAIVLGGVFLGFEIHDFFHLVAAGAPPERSGFLSMFFLLVATHGAHMAIGLLWMAVMLGQIVTIGFTEEVVARLLNLRMFWQFQASVWVCVFAFVYLRGAF